MFSVCNAAENVLIGHTIVRWSETLIMLQDWSETGNITRYYWWLLLVQSSYKSEPTTAYTKMTGPTSDISFSRIDYFLRGKCTKGEISMDNTKRKRNKPYPSARGNHRIEYFPWMSLSKHLGKENNEYWLLGSESRKVSSKGLLAGHQGLKEEYCLLGEH